MRRKGEGPTRKTEGFEDEGEDRRAHGAQALPPQCRGHQLRSCSPATWAGTRPAAVVSRITPCVLPRPQPRSTPWASPVLPQRHIPRGTREPPPGLRPRPARHPHGRGWAPRSPPPKAPCPDPPQAAHSRARPRSSPHPQAQGWLPAGSSTGLLLPHLPCQQPQGSARHILTSSTRPPPRSLPPAERGRLPLALAQVQEMGTVGVRPFATRGAATGAAATAQARAGGRQLLQRQPKHGAAPGLAAGGEGAGTATPAASGSASLRPAAAQRPAWPRQPR